jgi:hypothetical protein
MSNFKSRKMPIRINASELPNSILVQPDEEIVFRTVSEYQEVEQEDLNDKYEILIDMNLNIDPEVRLLAGGESAFREFINQSMPDHLQTVHSSLEASPDYFEFDYLATGYVPGINSCHMLKTPFGELEVVLYTELMRRDGNRSYWRTTVTTRLSMDEFLREHGDPQQ